MLLFLDICVRSLPHHRMTRSHFQMFIMDIFVDSMIHDSVVSYLA